VALVAAASLTAAAPVAGQVADTEPNNSCAAAQDIGTPALPFTLSGGLESTPSAGDIDFFHVTATPSTTVQLDLEGAATGAGTLGDPLLGVFDSACSLILSNDEGGVPPNARVQLGVPSDGVLVVAATSCCDYGFLGDGFGTGSYRLTISQLAVANSVGGRVVDANTGLPLAGVAFVELYRCNNGSCDEYVSAQSTDALGEFRFTNGFGATLTVGTYALRVSAGPQYQSSTTQPFELAESQDYSAGDIGLLPVPLIGSIGGRVIDAATGVPLRGDGPPFAVATLQQCDLLSGCFPIVGVQTDTEGRFLFTSDPFGFPLPAGSYSVAISADQYQSIVLGPYDIAEGQILDLGDISLTSLSVRFSEIRPCGNLPPEGGTCTYSFRITNALSTTISGLAWSNVQALDGTGLPTTSFQPGLPVWLLLEPGESRVVQFDFEVPSKVRDGTSICADGLASQGSDFFDVVGQRHLFCITKGFTGFRLATEKQARALAQPNGHRVPAQRHTTKTSK
jgi:5-hydroxyisourate hydrolase-like protein (transthyretin family)